MAMRRLPQLLLLALLVFPAALLLGGARGGPGLLVAAQDATEDEEAVEDTIVEDEDDEAEVEEDEPTDLTEEKEEEDLSGEPKASPSADTTILFVKGEDFPANNIVKFLVGFTNKGTEDFIVESLDASFRYPQDYQFYIQNFTALSLNTVVPPQRQATFEYSFIPAEPMGGRPFGLVINLNYRDASGNVFQDAVFNQTVTIIEKEDGLDGETIFMYMFLAGLGLLVIVGLHQLLESRKRKRPVQKVEMGTSNQNDVDMSWIPQETLNQINKASPRRLPYKRAQKRPVGSDDNSENSSSSRCSACKQKKVLGALGRELPISLTRGEAIQKAPPQQDLGRSGCFASLQFPGLESWMHNSDDSLAHCPVKWVLFIGRHIKCS
ncbi:translocon-associated protein subunit alpha isoform X2 [Passer montanus]|uniref:translocon-associated protein subunit alpha isoform X2 n=1 Tax=Passer montanus TaxID=9160 RepID=UPI0019603202|nr:translocon-associated protein subunit alpha isoform X2 [Passer montanus]